jgi:hypothetical protein
MKHFTHIFLLLFLCSTVQSQFPGPGYPCNTLPCCLECYTTAWYDTVDIQSNLNLFQVDTVDGTDIWQFGNSTKVSFINELGFVTDSIDSYPVNAKGILEYRMLNYGNSIMLFEHKYSTDSLIDGGYVRVSCDAGQSWHNLGTSDIDNLGCSSYIVNYVNYPNYWDGNPSTIQDTIHAFTGNGDWTWSGVQFSEIAVFQENNTSKTSWNDSIYFQFVFESDSVNTGKDGWMIRKIVNATADIAAGINDLQSGNATVFYPNPTSETIQIELGSVRSEVIINAYNVLGELIQAERREVIGIVDYKMPTKKGIYLIQLIQDDGKVKNLKVVKE